MKEYTVAVYCASSSKINSRFLDAATDLGKELARIRKKIIYGGGKIGAMGKLADGAIMENGSVAGVIPEFLQDFELGHDRIEELRVVKNMHLRQAMMLMNSNCVVALPGGVGTIVELMEAVAWKKLGLIISPIIIINIDDYFKDLIKMLEKAAEERFLPIENLTSWSVVSSVGQAVELIEQYLPPIEKTYEFNVFYNSLRKYDFDI